MNPYAAVTARIVALLEAGTAPWRQPWSGGYVAPRNLDTGRAYRGINTVVLGLCAGGGYFATRKQGERLGGTLREGAKGWPVVFYRSVSVKKTDKTTGEEKEKSIPMMRLSTAYHVTDFDGLEDPAALAQPPREISPIEAAEAIVNGWETRPAITHAGGRAFYMPATDTITLPVRSAFHDAASYYATLFHELGHATGHSSRLGRDLSGHHGDHRYSREELIAEMTSAFLCVEAGISCAELEENAAAYLSHWIRVLKGSPALAVRAAAGAQKAADLILGRDAKSEDVRTAADAQRELARLRSQTPDPRETSEVVS